MNNIKDSFIGKKSVVEKIQSQTKFEKIFEEIGV